jgi:hypothetical protein
MTRFLVLGCLILAASTLAAQDEHRILSNTDVLNMAKSGMSEKTIVLLIQQSPANFDTAPEALIELKKGGVSDEVLNAMVLAVAPRKTPSADDGIRDGSQLLAKALGAIGTPEQLVSVHSTRVKFALTQTTASGTVSYQVERTTVYPDKLSVTSQASTGLLKKIVITPEFNYQASGNMEGTLAAPRLEELRSGIEQESAYMAQHLRDYTCASEGTEQVGDVATAKLRIKRQGGGDLLWNIDPNTGRLLRARSTGGASGETIVDYSDWRLVDGMYHAFKRHVVENGRISDVTIMGFEVNPQIDASVFAAPKQTVAGAFTFKVRQSESVPYVVETGGGVSTNCQISGSTSTTMSAYTAGNTTFGTATSTPDLHMNCNSSQTSVKWQHVLNAMFVEASDGNAYIIACDRAWRWSKCSGLKPGDTFNARRTDKGFVVQFFNTKQQEKEATYAVLQAKSLR